MSVIDLASTVSLWLRDPGFTFDPKSLAHVAVLKAMLEEEEVQLTELDLEAAPPLPRIRRVSLSGGSPKRSHFSVLETVSLSVKKDSCASALRESLQTPPQATKDSRDKRCRVSLSGGSTKRSHFSVLETISEPVEKRAKRE